MNKNSPASRQFKIEAVDALNNSHLRQSLRGAMDGLMSKRQATLSDNNELQQLRDVCQNIRQHALSRLPELLEQLESRLTELGVHVHFAQTGDEACQIIDGIAKSHQAKLMVKGKSMVSEEVHLNEYLAERSVQAIESDMGEYILQLAGEKPTHIVMPAIHKTKEDVSVLFHEHLQSPLSDDVDELIGIGRAALRNVYRHADIGLSGVNFAVAQTGTLCLVENEGNGRLSTSIPPVHIAITGIEKVVANLSDVVPLYSLLTRSAIGQNITTYFNMITGPRRCDEKDGPQEMHLVLLDNGRSQAYADEQMRQTLQCIRCGACMNHCPVYTRVGGAAYGTTYPGPIGEIISPHLMGLEDTKDLPTASSLCGACAEVCPVKIPIPDLLVRLRTEAQRNPNETVLHPIRGQGASYSVSEKMAWRLFAGISSHPSRYRLLTKAASTFRGLMPKRQMGWEINHTPLQPAAKTLHQRLQEKQKH